MLHLLVTQPILTEILIVDILRYWKSFVSSKSDICYSFVALVICPKFRSFAYTLWFHPFPPLSINTWRMRQDGRHFTYDIFNCIFLNEKVWILIKISLKFVPNGPISNIPPLGQMMACRRPGDKPSSEPIMVRLPTHICVILHQWKTFLPMYFHFILHLPGGHINIKMPY